MKKHTTVYAKDQLMSRALELPYNLTIEANSARGTFEIQFLASLSNSDLASLKKISDSYGNAASSVNLKFFTSVDGSNSCPTLLKNFRNYNWKDLIRIEFHPSQPFLEHTDTPYEHYVSVVLVSKS